MKKINTVLIESAMLEGQKIHFYIIPIHEQQMLYTDQAIRNRNIVTTISPQSAPVENLPLLVKVTILRIVPRLENICQEKIRKFRIWFYSM